MATKLQKIFFIVATVLCAVALVIGAIAAYFGISAIATYAAAEGELEGAVSLDTAFLFLFLVLFALISWCFSAASLPFYIVGPMRAEHKKLRRAALILLLVEGALFLINMGLFAFCLIAF